MMKAGPSPGNDDKVSILLYTSEKEILAPIKFCELVRIGYIYNLAIFNFGEFISRYDVCVRVHDALRDSWIFYIMGEFEIWR